MTQSNPIAPPPSSKPEPSWNDVFAYPLACIGAMLGAAAGGFIANIAAHSGFYAIIVIGILAGFGASLLSRRHNWIIALIAGLIALAAGIFTEWYLYPFLADDSLSYFLQHLGDLPGFRLLMHALSAGCAAFIAWRK